ncbi:MAG: putative peptidase [Siphoviridae sp. ctjeG17]|nr:MAG: putative peptidase [Siphoviridae sp. ctjeG17]
MKQQIKVSSIVLYLFIFTFFTLNALAYDDGAIVSDPPLLTESIKEFPGQSNHLDPSDDNFLQQTKTFFQNLGLAFSFDDSNIETTDILGKVESGMCQSKQVSDVFTVYAGGKFSPNSDVTVKSGARCQVGQYIEFVQVTPQKQVTMFDKMWYKANSADLLDMSKFYTKGLGQFNYYYVCYSCNVNIIRGCTDSTATNYNARANKDDSSCQYDVQVQGCTNSQASNYNPLAEKDDGSCVISPPSGQNTQPPPSSSAKGSFIGELFDSNMTTQDILIYVVVALIGFTIIIAISMTGKRR